MPGLQYDRQQNVERRTVAEVKQHLHRQNSRIFMHLSYVAHFCEISDL